jgi:hypothetical protein
LTGFDWLDWPASLKQNGWAAVATDELRVASPARSEADAMSAAHADGWMRDVQLLVAFGFQEGVAAMAQGRITEVGLNRFAVGGSPTD